MNEYYVYIMSSNSNVIYIGITNDIQRRVFEHKTGKTKSFSKKYKTHKLVYYECFTDVNDAIEREKKLKKWRRGKKIALIEKKNPFWEDLSSF